MECFSANFTGTERTMVRNCERQSAIYECCFVDFEDRGTLARFTERVWEMGKCTSTVSALARRGCLGAHFKCAGEASGLWMANDGRKSLQGSSACSRINWRQWRHGPHKRGLNTKIHLAVDALGMPVRAIVTDSPRSDCKEAISLIENLPCKVLLADRGYNTDEIIKCAKNSGIQPVIPPKKNRKVQRTYVENLYKKRHLVENAPGAELQPVTLKNFPLLSLLSISPVL